MKYKPSTLTIRNNVAELVKIGPFIEGILNETPLDRSARVRIRVGLDEAMTNCVMYAYDSPGKDIEVTASIEDKQLKFVVKDAGVPFNPLEYRAEVSDELRPGGLGISMMRTIFDDVQYERKGEKNILKLIKNI